MHLLNADPDRGRTYDVVCAVTTEPTFAEEVRVERRGVPTRPHDIRAFYASRKALLGRAPDVRAAYDAETVAMLKPYAPDLILAAGYLYVLTEPMLAAFRHRILNLHFSDLALRTPDGAPGFPGIGAVRDALNAGCPETRATVHLVSGAVAAGPPLVRSWPFPVSPMVEDARAWAAADLLRAYGFAHEQWMMRACAGPMWSAAIQLVTGGAVALDRLAASPPAIVPWELSRRGELMPALAAPLARAGRR
jgi:folate-dependent phosphoribosylglycinamide formyltransferase PurN